MSAVLAVYLLAAIPVASADTCVVTVTTVGGQHLSFTVNAAPGTPFSAMNLPVPGPVASVSESCAPASTSSTTTTTSSSTSTSSTSTSTSTTGSQTPKTTGPGTKQPGSGSHQQHGKGPGSSSGKQTGKHSGGTSGGGKGKGQSGGKGTGQTKKAVKPLKPTGQGGVPTAANPTFSFALPGPAPVGVPNFFIDSFRIPPFLLPIYQAAGIQYDVPWQVLAAINEIETDYGRNLSVSSAGAVGWMQFLPSTWKTWGIDANGDRVADPYNPVDAIFSAARYLHAAGASKNVNQAIFAYNHAGWYVQSVLLRAKLIGGMPDQLIGALSGLVENRFPVARSARYRDGGRQASIVAAPGSPVIAVGDGKVVAVGRDAARGRFVELQDVTGNVYTYAQLGSIARTFSKPAPVRVTRISTFRRLALTPLPAPRSAATAGRQTAGVVPPRTAHTARPLAAPMVKERLFAHPSRPRSYAAGGVAQVRRGAAAPAGTFQSSSAPRPARRVSTRARLRRGSVVVAGTILGRIGSRAAGAVPHMEFMIRPAGRNGPRIDPKPILDGWKLLGATAVYRPAADAAFPGAGGGDPTSGQILLMGKQQLADRVLRDARVQLPACVRADIGAGLIDRRVLATLEFLSVSGLGPDAAATGCGRARSMIEVTAINGVPVRRHQGPGSITDLAVRRLLTLQGAAQPDQIIAGISVRGHNNTLALPDHAGRIEISFTRSGPGLAPGQWRRLIGRMARIPEPVVPIAPSRYATRPARHS